MIRAIVFDVAGVITGDNIRLVVKIISERFGLNYENVLKTIFYNNYSLGAVGKLNAREFHEKCAKDLGINISYDEFVKEYMKAYPLDKEMLKLVELLSKNYRVFVLSNQIEINTIVLHEILDAYFEKIIFSNEVKLAKPDPEIYKLLFNGSNLKPDECIFIDDREKSIMPAKEIGMKTVLFKNKEQLMNELRSFKVSI